MNAYRIFLLTGLLICVCSSSFSQQRKDSLVVRNDSVLSGNGVSKVLLPNVKDSSKKIFVPRTAAIRSAILPGLGQIYNKKYWKLPLVYGALGTTALVFRYNLNYYNNIRFAYNVLVNRDTGRYKEVDDELQPFLVSGSGNALQALRSARNETRKNMDYSVLVFILFWALNVVDATVDAHLKGFDVSGDLSLKIKPSFHSARTPGLSFIFDVHKSKPRLLALP